MTVCQPVVQIFPLKLQMPFGKLEAVTGRNEKVYLLSVYLTSKCVTMARQLVQ